MPMNLGGGYAAGGGAEGLQELWQLLAQQEDAQARRKLEGERLKLDARRVEQDDELRRLALEDRADARAAAQQTRDQAGAKMIAGTLRPRSLVTPDQSAALKAGGMGDKLVAPTLDSRNIGQGMTSTPNPGRGESFAGLPDQLEEDAQDAELERQKILQPKLRGRLEMMSMIPRNQRSGLMPELMRDREAERQATLDDKEHMLRLAASLRPPAQAHARYNVVQGSDKEGKAALIRTNVDTGQVEVLPMPDGANFTKRDQPATQDQSNLALFANRVEQADPILTTLTPNITKRNPAMFATQQWLDQPVLQDKELQQYQQAARNLINAVLRRESGAAISPSEFAEARKQYLPVPGDDETTLAQKAQTRKIVLENYKRGAGPAYKPMPATGGGFQVIAVRDK